MRTTHDFGESERGAPAIVTIGAFDGVHRGHQYLIRQVVERARQLGFLSVVVTFDPRPEVAFRPGSKQLTGGAAKERTMAALGVDELVILPFSLELASVPAGEFLAKILDHIDLKEMWVGADFAFGHQRQGTVEYLLEAGKAANFALHVIQRQSLDGNAGAKSVSSSLIREHVAGGDVAGAAKLLGHYTSLEGPVVRGHGRGRALGFPTANIRPPDHQLLPATGIYAGYVSLDGRRLPSAISVGYNVVFGGQEIVVEAHILDFDEDIYDEIVGLEFVDRVRDERNFADVDALVAEMHHDVKAVRGILANAIEPGELVLTQ